MKLRSGKEIGEDKEQTLEAIKKDSHPKPVSLKIKEVRMSTLWELAAPNLETQSMSITYAALDKPLKLNSGFINLLPKFHGLERTHTVILVNFLLHALLWCLRGFLKAKLG